MLTPLLAAETWLWSEAQQRLSEPGPGATSLPGEVATIGSAPGAGPRVTYSSTGRVLVLGAPGPVRRAADLLGHTLQVSLLTDTAAEAPARATTGAGRYRWLTGTLVSLSGFLGEFDLQYQLLKASQEGIPAVSETFDLVLDLRSTPAFAQHVFPPGYFYSPMTSGTVAQCDPRSVDLPTAVRQLRQLVGQFDKPRFFDYRNTLCAHGRQGVLGCSACVDLCSTAAIRSDLRQQQILVDPHLCMGCGVCSTVCPSGAIRFDYPDASFLGGRLKQALSGFLAQGGVDAIVLLYDHNGSRNLPQLTQFPAVVGRLVPVPVWDAASAGLEIWLSSVAYGASQVWVLADDGAAPLYLDALRQQMAVAQALLSGLGYTGRHFELLLAGSAPVSRRLELPMSATPKGVGQRASFEVQPDKRTSLELALAHLMAQAPSLPTGSIALPTSGSPLGALQIDQHTCTLCQSCVSACPSGALTASADAMQLRFKERSCVQCGLCVRTCPEHALGLLPRFNLLSERTQSTLLFEAESYHCVRCKKAFSSRKAVELMLTKLSGHPMFQGSALERLKMCGDCRVIDMHGGSP